MSDYPINAAELARLLLHDQSRVREYTREDYKFVQYEVRETLRKLKCPKQSSALRSDWVVDQDMARRVAQELGRSLPGGS